MFWFVTYSVTLVANWVFDWWSESLLRELSMKQEKFWLSLVETAFQFKYKILLIKSLICLRLNRLATWSAVLICHQRDLFTQINPFTAGMKTQKFLWILKDQNLRLQFGDTCLLVGPLLEPLDVVYLLFVIHLDWNLCRVEETTTFIVGYTLGPVSLWIATAISFDRLFALKLAMRLTEVVTIKKTYAVILTFWVMAMVLSSSYVAESLVSHSHLTVASCLAIAIPSCAVIFRWLRRQQTRPSRHSVRLLNEQQSPHHSQSKVVTVCRNFFGLWLLKHWKIRIAYRQWRSHKGMCACIHRREPEWTQIQTWETTHGENGLSLKQDGVLYSCFWQALAKSVLHITWCS